MLVRTDDNLYRVDRTWLGPKIIRFPWRATYTTYGLFVVVSVVTGFIAAKLHAPVNFLSVVCWLTACAVTAKRITMALDHDRPMGPALVRLGQELVAPRPIPTRPEGVEHALRVRRWRYGAQPETRRVVRLWLWLVAGILRAGTWLRYLPARFRRAERAELVEAGEVELAAELADVEELSGAGVGDLGAAHRAEPPPAVINPYLLLTQQAPPKPDEG